MAETLGKMVVMNMAPKRPLIIGTYDEENEARRVARDAALADGLEYTVLQVVAVMKVRKVVSRVVDDGMEKETGDASE